MELGKERSNQFSVVERYSIKYVCLISEEYEDEGKVTVQGFICCISKDRPKY